MPRPRNKSGGSHHWGREIAALGHEVRLIPPLYVKPYVKRQKNDASDAEAICEAGLRPTSRSAYRHTGPRQLTCRIERPHTRKHRTACAEPT